MDWNGLRMDWNGLGMDWNGLGMDWDVLGMDQGRRDRRIPEGSSRKGRPRVKWLEEAEKEEGDEG